MVHLGLESQKGNLTREPWVQMMWTESGGWNKLLHQLGRGEVHKSLAALGALQTLAEAA